MSTGEGTQIEALGPALRVGERVITPRDEVGFVTGATDSGFVHGDYAGALSRESSQFTLHARLLVRWPPNSPRPKPFRVARPTPAPEDSR